MKLLEVQLDFFVPLWRRVALVAFCFVWSLVEFNNGMVFWGAVFVAIGAYSLWQFFFDGWPARLPVSNQEEGDQVKSDVVEGDQVMSGSSAGENSASSFNGATSVNNGSTENTGSASSENEASTSTSTESKVSDDKSHV